MTSRPFLEDADSSYPNPARVQNTIPHDSRICHQSEGAACSPWRPSYRPAGLSLSLSASTEESCDKNAGSGLFAVEAGQPDCFKVYQFSERGVVTKMDMKSPWHELAKRAANFRWNGVFEGTINDSEEFFKALCGLQSVELAKWMQKNSNDTSEILKAVFYGVYDMISNESSEYAKFRYQDGSLLFADTLQACLFTALGIFLNQSKRIRGKSLGEFVFQYSPIEYHRDYSSFRESSDDRLIAEETALRQKRHRVLSSRAVRDINPQWSAIRKDSEHEWSLYFKFQYADSSQANTTLNHADTFKRIGNLYNDINNALKTPRDSGYSARLDVAYKKFSSKLKKIRYADYLELLKELLHHIRNDKMYYGINLYRFEKRLKAFAYTYQVNELLKCQTEEEKIELLNKSVAVNNIWFPKLYKGFASFPNVVIAGLYANIFSEFLNTVVISSCLVWDELVEEGLLGEKWESLFINTTNEMAEFVFYAPDEIDFTESDGSQEAFQKLLDVQVRCLISQEKQQKEEMQ